MTYTLFMKQPEYREGPEALENFKRLASAILQPPAKTKEADQEVCFCKEAAEIRQGLEPHAIFSTL